MDFEDRLKNHLQNQSQEVHIEPATVGDVAHRSSAKRQRRMAASAMAVAVVLMGVGGFIVGGNSNESPVSIAEVAEDTSQPDGSTTEDGVPTETLTGPLEFDDVSDTNSPGGFNVFTSVAGADGVYYTLSTSPGEPGDDFDWRPDTLYRYDDGWSNSDFGDRFVTDFGESDGVLYALSTGSPTSDEPAMGTSADGGESWQWTPLEVSDELRSNVRFSTAESNGDLLIIASSSGTPDYEAAAQLAIDAGADIDLDTNEVIDVNAEGIRWMERPELAPCQAEMDRRYGEFETNEGGLVPFPFDEDVNFENLTPEQEAELEAWELANAQAHLDIVKSIGEVEGCEFFSQCLTDSETRQRELFDEQGDYPDDPAEQEAFELEQQRIYEEFEAWLTESGCSTELGYDAYEEENFQMGFASWDELGVLVPEVWKSRHEALLFADGAVTSAGPVFTNEAGYLIRVAARNGGFEASFESLMFGDYLENEPEAINYVSADGINWENAGTGVISWQDPVEFNGGSFSIDWSETEDDYTNSATLNRNGESITVADLVGDSGIDTKDLHLNQVVAGDYGVVAWAARWNETGELNPVDFVPDIDTVVFFSQDGINWTATELEGLDVSHVSVGTDSVMVFAADPFKANDAEANQPVLLGRATNP